MMIIRLVCLAGFAILLANCSGSGRSQQAQGCTQIPQQSTGPCRVGMSPKAYYDDSWKSYPPQQSR